MDIEAAEESTRVEQSTGVLHLVHLCQSMRREAEQLSHQLPSRNDGMPWAEKCARAHLTIAVVILQAMAAAREVETWHQQQPLQRKVGALTAAMQTRGAFYIDRGRSSSSSS